jgi:hypothetical protein
VNIEPIKYIQCPSCGNCPTTEGVKFCYRDGTALVAKTARCACGHYLDYRIDKFCEFCGTAASEAKLIVVEV